MSKDKRKKLRDKQRRLRQIRQRRVEIALPPNSLIVHDPPGLARMSEVLIDFIEPYREDAESEEALRKLVTLATIAWNAGLMPMAKREKFVQDMAKSFPADVRTDFRTVLDPLVRRKEEHFAEHRRAIFDFSLTFDANGPYLQVVSSLPNEA